MPVCMGGVYCTDMANTKLSLRVLWTLYKRTAIAQGVGGSKRDLTLAQVAFYSGARGVLKVLDYMLEHGEQDTALRTIRRFGRQAKVLQGSGPGANCSDGGFARLFG
jgi:hypothetical protein